MADLSTSRFASRAGPGLARKRSSPPGGPGASARSAPTALSATTWLTPSAFECVADRPTHRHPVLDEGRIGDVVGKKDEGH